MTAPTALADPRSRLAHLPRTATRARRTAILTEILTDFGFLAAKARHVGVRELVEDFDRALAAGLDLPPETASALTDIRAALQGALPVVLGDWSQLAGQLLGRLDASAPGLVAALHCQARSWQGRPWLEPTSPTLLRDSQSAWYVGTAPGEVADLTAVGPARCAALTPDGIVRVWSVRSGDLEQTLVCNAPSRCVAADADGRILVIGSEDGTVSVWDVSAGVLVGRFRAHQWEVTALAMLPSGPGLVTGAADGTVTRWASLSGQDGTVLGKHRGWITGITVAAAGSQVLSCSSDGLTMTWPAPGRVLLTAGTWANGLAIAPDGTVAAVVCEDGSSVLCPLPQSGEPDRRESTAEQPARVMRSSAWASAITFAGTGGRVASGDAAGVIQVWDIGRRQIVGTLEGHAGPVTALTRMADGSVLSGGADGRILRWDFDGSGPISRRADCHRDCVSAIAVHPAERRAVSAGHDGEIRTWSLPDGKPVGVFALHGWKCMSAAFTPDGQQVVSGGTDGKIRLWEWPTGRAVAVLAGHRSPVNRVLVTGDGRHVLSASDDATIRAWDLRTGDEERCWLGHQQGVRCIALTPDDSRLVSVSVDGTVRIWERGGRQLFCHDVHRDWVNGVAVTLDGRCALSVSDSPAARLVLTSINTGEMLLRWEGHAAAAFAVATAAASSLAVTAGLDGRVRAWDMSEAPDRMPPLTCEFSAGEELYACAVGPGCRVVMAGTKSGRVHTLIRHGGSGDGG